MSGRLCDPIARWVIALERLDSAKEPITAWKAMRLEGEERPRVRPAKRIEAMRRAGLVELAMDGEGNGWKRWTITPKGREWLREALTQMDEFLRGEW